MRYGKSLTAQDEHTLLGDAFLGSKLFGEAGDCGKPFELVYEGMLKERIEEAGELSSIYDGPLSASLSDGSLVLFELL